MAWDRVMFWLLRPASVMLGALIRVMTCLLGLVVLAAVVPEEIKLPNCSPIWAVEESVAGPVARTTGVVLELFCEIVRPRMPPAILKLRALTRAGGLGVGDIKLAIIVHLHVQAAGGGRITLLT